MAEKSLKTMKAISGKTTREIINRVITLDIKQDDIVSIISHDGQIHLFYYS